MTQNYQSADVWSRTKTINGYPVDEVRSVFQKSVRRGWLEEAILAAFELHQSGLETEELLWRRIEIIATEEVGFGLVTAPAIIEALNAQRQRYADRTERWIYAVQAVRIIVTNKKDRTAPQLAQWAIEVTSRGERQFEIQDFMVDYHTRRGVELGRGPEHWTSAGGGDLENMLEGVDTKYLDYLNALRGKTPA